MTGPREQAAAIERLLAVVAGLTSDLDLASVLGRIGDAGKDLLEAEASGVLGSRGDELEVLASSGHARGVEGARAPYAGSAVEAMDRGGLATLVSPMSAFPMAAQLAASFTPMLHTIAVARIKVNGQTHGALAVMFAQPGRTLTDLDRHLLELLAGHAGVAIANAEAYASVLRQQQHEHAIVDAMADGLAVIDAAHLVTVWNAAATALTGLSGEAALGRPLPFPHDLAGIGFEYQLPNGRWVEVLCSPLAGHEAAETVVTFRDISAAKMVEEAKDLFLATTGHELRTPLTVIRGFTGTLVDRWDDLTQDERREAVRIIAVRADALGALVEQVLASSHAEAGARRLERIPMDLGPVLSSAAIDVGSLSDRHRITVDVDAALPPVLADSQALRTILGHLVDNAVKYSPDGGVIAVSASVAQDGRSVRVHVDDEGIGVSGEDEERVFERFFQADGGDRRQQDGFGLGLYIVRRLVQAHDGTVSLTRRPDGHPGSRVELCLPIAQLI